MMGNKWLASELIEINNEHWIWFQVKGCAQEPSYGGNKKRIPNPVEIHQQ